MLRVGLLFFTGLIIIGGISCFALYSISMKYVREKLTVRQDGIAQDIVRYIEEYPAHRWLIDYWYNHFDELDIEYDTDFTQATETRRKYDILTEHYPDFLPEYATSEEAASLSEEDQKLYAEIVYSWLMTRMNSVAIADDLSYLFGVIAEEPYDKQFILFITGKDDRGQGTEPGRYYPVGSVISVTKNQQEVMRNAANGIPGIVSN